MDQEMKNSLTDSAYLTHSAAIKKGVFSYLKRNGTLRDKVEEYIRSCDAPKTESDSKSRRAPIGRLPNLAGLCRYLGTGLSDLKAFSAKYPRDYDNLLAILYHKAECITVAHRASQCQILSAILTKIKTVVCAIFSICIF